MIRAQRKTPAAMTKMAPLKTRMSDSFLKSGTSAFHRSWQEQDS